MPSNMQPCRPVVALVKISMLYVPTPSLSGPFCTAKLHAVMAPLCQQLVTCVVPWALATLA